MHCPICAKELLRIANAYVCVACQLTFPARRSTRRKRRAYLHHHFGGRL